MTSKAPVFLFIPVSSAEGIGEYMRSLIVANQILQHWPNAQISFILSEQAPYFLQCPFDVLTTPKSPTKHTKEVNQIIEQLKPDVVIFDAKSLSDGPICTIHLPMNAGTTFHGTWVQA